jgi:hypothetical protein
MGPWSGFDCCGLTLGVDSDRFNFILACEKESLRSLRDTEESGGCLMSMVEEDGGGTL